MQHLLHADELGHLTFHEPAHGNPRPARDDVGDVFVVDLLLEHLLLALQLLEPGRLRRDLRVELAHGAVAQLGGAFEVAVALGAFSLGAGCLEVLLEGADLGDRVLLVLPVRDHRVALFRQFGELFLQRGEARQRVLVGLFVERRLLDLELADAALDHVDLEWHRVDLDAQPRRRLVDEVDRLVGELAAGDVAIGQQCSRDERRVLDPHAVVNLVALLEPAQDRDGVVDRRLADIDLLEATLERRVLLDVLPILVERGRADHAQLAARQHRLDHVAGIHRAFGRARADDRVELVDERDHLALGVGDLLQDRLQPILELAAVLRAGDHRANVERDQALVAQTLRHVSLDDPAGKPFDDGGLADAGFADEDGVVLGPA